MKTIFTFLLATGLAATAFAQENGLQSGKLFVGGTLGYSSNWSKTEISGGSVSVTEDGPKTTNFNVLPNINYMLSNRLAVGLGIGYDYTKTTRKDGEDEETEKIGTFVVQPNVTYFMPFGNEKFGLLVNAGIPLSFGKRTEEDKIGSTTVSNETDLRGWGIAASPGFYYFPSPKFMLTGQLGNLFSYTSSTTKEGETTTVKTTRNELEILNFSTLGLTIGGSFFF